MIETNATQPANADSRILVVVFGTITLPNKSGTNMHEDVGAAVGKSVGDGVLTGGR